MRALAEDDGEEVKEDEEGDLSHEIKTEPLPATKKRKANEKKDISRRRRGPLSILMRQKVVDEEMRKSSDGGRKKKKKKRKIRATTKNAMSVVMSIMKGTKKPVEDTISDNEKTQITRYNGECDERTTTTTNDLMEHQEVQNEESTFTATPKTTQENLERGESGNEEEHDEREKDDEEDEEEDDEEVERMGDDGLSIGFEQSSCETKNNTSSSDTKPRQTLSGVDRAIMDAMSRRSLQDRQLEEAFVSFSSKASVLLGERAQSNVSMRDNLRALCAQLRETEGEVDRAKNKYQACTQGR